MDEQEAEQGLSRATGHLLSLANFASVGGVLEVIRFNSVRIYSQKMIQWHMHGATRPLHIIEGNTDT